MEELKKQCNTCGYEGPKEEFRPQVNHRNGNKYWTRCKQCYNNAMRASRYSITIADVIDLLDVTHCPICEEEFGKESNKVIDHCHTTGEVRGVLCRACNSGIGHLKDSKKLLKNAIKYLDNM